MGPETVSRHSGAQVSDGVRVAAGALAALPMYELPELAAATRAWWDGLASHMAATGLTNVPEHLTEAEDLYGLWTSKSLLFAQTCGYPLTHRLKGRVRLVATPAYDCRGCLGATYRSFLLVRASDPASDLRELKGRIVAVNGPDSQSGYSALRCMVAPLANGHPFFASVMETGGHRASMAAVAAGSADLCAVDCVTYALLVDRAPALTQSLRIICEGPPAPSLPYITSAATTDDCLERMRQGLFAALADKSLATIRACLRLAGAEILPLKAYDRIVELERDAAGLGYSTVA